MKLMNRDVDYAVRALVFMAQANKPMVAVVNMREETGVTGPFLRKIMQKLQKAGFVHSVKGKRGGFALARRPENISLGGLIEALQGPLKLNDCVFRKKLCNRHGSCMLRRKIGDVEKRLVGEIEGITLRDLL